MQSKILTSFLMAGVLFAGGLALHADETNAPAATAPGANATPPGQGNVSMQPHMRPLPGTPVGGPLGALTEEQRASYQKNITDKRAEMMELNSKLQVARQELNELMFPLKVDENQIRTKVTEEAKIEADIMILRAQAFADIQPPLTPEQLEKFKQAATPRPMIRPSQPPPAAPSTTTTNQDQSAAPGKQ